MAPTRTARPAPCFAFQPPVRYVESFAPERPAARAGAGRDNELRRLQRRSHAFGESGRRDEVERRPETDGVLVAKRAIEADMDLLPDRPRCFQPGAPELCQMHATAATILFVHDEFEQPVAHERLQGMAERGKIHHKMIRKGTHGRPVAAIDLREKRILRRAKTT